MGMNPIRQDLLPPEKGDLAAKIRISYPTTGIPTMDGTYQKLTLTLDRVLLMMMNFYKPCMT